MDVADGKSNLIYCPSSEKYENTHLLVKQELENLGQKRKHYTEEIRLILFWLTELRWWMRMAQKKHWLRKCDILCTFLCILP